MNLSRALIGIAAITLVSPALPAFAETRDPWWPQYGNSSCMEDAVRERDDSLISAYNAYNSSMIAALRRRTQAHVRLWSDRTYGGQDISSANRAFNSASNEAERRLSDARDRAAEQFSADERRCRTGSQTWYEPSSCSTYCPSTPAGCRYTERRMVNGCIVNCGRLVCEYSRNYSYPDYDYPEYNGRETCRSYGSCRSGYGCPEGAACSGYPNYTCYPYGCPYPIGSPYRY